MTKDKFHPVHSVYEGVFNTVSGRRVTIHNPTLDMISVQDIASSLAKICRFGGHVRKFYSVAQHSVLVCRMAPPELRKAALIHDFAEAYVGDVIKPLKVELDTSYSVIEFGFEAVICDKLGVDVWDLEKIKDYDNRACEIEHEALQRGNYADFADTMRTLLPDDPLYWNPDYGRTRLLLEFHEVFKGGVS